MTTHRLTDLQRTLLATAARRDDGSLLPPSDTLDHPREVLAKAITALLRRKLAGEVELEEQAMKPRTLDDRCWREKGDTLLGVVITTAGRSTIVIEEALQADGDPPAEITAAKASPSKSAMVKKLLARPRGATMAEMIAATGWQKHSVRAFLTGLRKKGNTLVREERRNGELAYRLTADEVVQ